jgi:regulator of replication initiation timing
MTILGMMASAGGLVCSGGLLKVLVDRFSMTKNQQYTALIMLVEQLQKNVNENNDEIAELKRDVRDWRDKYYKEFEEKNKLSLELNKLRLELQKFNKNHNEN